jgi:hypothetical protein
MNNLKKKKTQKSGGAIARFEKDSYSLVNEWVSETAKLIRGDPPKNCAKSPLKIEID